MAQSTATALKEAEEIMAELFELGKRDTCEMLGCASFKYDNGNLFNRLTNRSLKNILAYDDVAWPGDRTIAQLLTRFVVEKHYTNDFENNLAKAARLQSQLRNAMALHNVKYLSTLNTEALMIEEQNDPEVAAPEALAPSIDVNEINHEAQENDMSTVTAPISTAKFTKPAKNSKAPKAISKKTVAKPAREPKKAAKSEAPKPETDLQKANRERKERLGEKFKHTEKVVRITASNDVRKIKLLVKENPKRGLSYDRYELYRTAKTVADYVAAGGKGADISYDLKHGFIEVS